jgi:hypothetical protein
MKKRQKSNKRPGVVRSENDTKRKERTYKWVSTDKWVRRMMESGDDKDDEEKKIEAIAYR